MSEPDWKAARLAASKGDVAGIERSLGEDVLAEGRWFIVQLAPSDDDALAIAELLLRHGAPANQPDGSGDRALHICAKFPSVLQRLLAAGANANAANLRGHTPLMMAADTGPAASVRCLLAAGADPNLADADGGTALLFACDHGKRDCIEALLDAGARVDIVTAGRRTPLGLAKKSLPKDTELLARLGGPKRASAKTATTKKKAKAKTTASSPGRGLGRLEEPGVRATVMTALADIAPGVRDDVETALGSGEFQRLTVRLYDGDVRLAGTRELSREVHVFTGNLDVDGALINPAAYALLLVKGSLRARHFVDGCTAVIGGSLHAEGLVFGESGSNGFLAVGGDVEARVVAENGHGIVVRGQIRAAHTLVLQNLIESSDGQVAPYRGPLDTIFTDDVRDDLLLDTGKLLQAVASDEDPLRP